MKKLIAICAVVLLLSACGSSRYSPCPAYGNYNYGCGR